MKIIFLFFFSCLAINAGEFSLQCGFYNNNVERIDCIITKKDGNKRAGHIQILKFEDEDPDNNNFADIFDLQVPEEFRGKGFSNVLLYEGITNAITQWSSWRIEFSDVSNISLETESSHYARYGFTCVKNSNIGYNCEVNSQDFISNPENIARYEAGITNIDIEPFITTIKRKDFYDSSQQVNHF